VQTISFGSFQAIEKKVLRAAISAQAPIANEKCFCAVGTQCKFILDQSAVFEPVLDQSIAYHKFFAHNDKVLPMMAKNCLQNLFTFK